LSEAFKWYSTLPPKENKLNKFWTFGIALARSVPEVSDFKELVLWCADKFDIGRRIIEIQGKSLISLAPSVFKRMLILSVHTLTFKNYEADNFLKTNNMGMELLEIFLTSPTNDSNSIQVEVCYFKYPYREFAWLFARIIG